MSEETLYKVLAEDGSSIYGVGKWNLPTEEGKPGAWMPGIRGTLVPCARGYHVCREQDLIYWLSGPRIHRVEVRGRRVDVGGEDSKVVVSGARLWERLETWNRSTIVAFAADCAEHTLSVFEERFPNDDRPRKAIEAARQCAKNSAYAASHASYAASHASYAAAYAASHASYAAASDASYAASHASYAAAYAASDASYAASHAVNAAVNASYAAAYASYAVNAASHAAAYAAREGERTWQTQRLFQYLRGEVQP